MPWALSLYWRCRQFGGLPAEGGVLDQDDHLMNLMEVCADAWRMSKSIDFTDPDFRERYWWIFPDERPKKKEEQGKK